MAHQRLAELDFLARRYGKLPSELASLPITDFQFNLLVAERGIVHETRMHKQAEARSKLRRGR